MIEIKDGRELVFPSLLNDSILYEYVVNGSSRLSVYELSFNGINVNK